MTDYKHQIISAGKLLQSKSRDDQKSNHQKVIDWIETLDESTIPSTENPETTYKCLIKEWVAIFIKHQPNGTGSWLKTPTSTTS
jgi:hypothetical protein